MAKYVRRAFKRRPARGRRRFGKRPIRRKRYGRTRVSRWKAPLGNFPPINTVALRYVDTVALNASSTASAVNVFRANNIYDPDYTGTGHQPMYHDNYAAIYQKYRVNYATIAMVPMNTHAVNTTTPNQVNGTNIGDNHFFNSNEKACRIWIMRDETVNDYPSNINTLIETGNKNFVWRYCPQNTSQKMPILRMKVWPHTLMNIPKKDDRIGAFVGGSPSRECYFICGVSQIGDGSNPDAISCQFIITYNVTYTDPITNRNQDT